MSEFMSEFKKKKPKDINFKTW